jgi:hypothetical protein
VLQGNFFGWGCEVELFDLQAHLCSAGCIYISQMAIINADHTHCKLASPIHLVMPGIFGIDNGCPRETFSARWMVMLHGARVEPVNFQVVDLRGVKLYSQTISSPNYAENDGRGQLRLGLQHTSTPD